MPERLTQLYAKCTLCPDAASYGFPEGECPGCDGSGYVPQGQAPPCEDHEVLDAIALALIEATHLPISCVTREGESVEFTDLATGRRYEIVVREIDQAEDGDDEEDAHEEA